MRGFALIVAGEPTPRRFPDLEALARDLLLQTGSPALTLSRLTASYPGEIGGFPAVKVVDPKGDWVATAAIQGQPCEDLARAVAKAAAARGAAKPEAA